jgi:hypothetical protein
MLYPLQEAQLVAAQEAQLLVAPTGRDWPSDREKAEKRDRQRPISSLPHSGQRPGLSARDMGKSRSNRVSHWQQRYS